MAVYVDDMAAPFGRMIMSHMIADSHEELLRMADALGLQRRWIQHAGTYREHFDVSRQKRAQAVRLGAIEVTQRELVAKLNERRAPARRRCLSCSQPVDREGAMQCDFCGSGGQWKDG